MRVLVGVVGEEYLEGSMTRTAWEAAVAGVRGDIPVTVGPDPECMSTTTDRVIGWARNFRIEGDEVWCDVDLVDALRAYPCAVVDLSPEEERVVSMFDSEPTPMVWERIKPRSKERV